MKQISNDSKYWIDEADTQCTVGFTKEFLSQLGMIWNLVQKNTEMVNVREGEIFAYIESSKCLMPLHSPIGGTRIKFNKLVLDKPNQITDQTWIIGVNL